MKQSTFLLCIVFLCSSITQAQKRARDLGIEIGVMRPGKWNAITDVPGVKVGHTTLIKADSIRTGATAIIPHDGNIFQSKVPAAFFAGNGFGKIAGTTQIIELGNLETPIILTNTLNVSTGMEAVIGHTLKQPGNENVQSVNAVVGETNDGWLNDIRGRHLTKEDISAAIKNAKSGAVMEGSVGAGTGTMCLGFKGGIGTASRILPQSLGGYSVGVIVQTNFGGVLEIAGVPIGKELRRFDFSNQLLNNVDGSCMIVVATNAPMDARNLERLAKRAFMGLAKTGGIASNGSGDYVLAFSTNDSIRVAFNSKDAVKMVPQIQNDFVSPLFMAAIEATEEAIINSLFMATTVTGLRGHKGEAMPVEKILEIMNKYNRIRK